MYFSLAYLRRLIPVSIEIMERMSHILVNYIIVILFSIGNTLIKHAASVSTIVALTFEWGRQTKHTACQMMVEAIDKNRAW